MASVDSVHYLCQTIPASHVSHAMSCMPSLPQAGPGTRRPAKPPGCDSRLSAHVPHRELPLRTDLSLWGPEIHQAQLGATIETPFETAQHAICCCYFPLPQHGHAFLTSPSPQLSVLYTTTTFASFKACVVRGLSDFFFLTFQWSPETQHGFEARPVPSSSDG